jgi:N-methylhydantoinase B
MARPAAGARSPRGASARLPRVNKTPRLDAVTAQIIRGAMETICYEISTRVSLAATSPILHPSGERNATILDAQGRLVAQWVVEPRFLLASTSPIRFALDLFGPGGLHDGDVLVANDPYHGGGHPSDYTVFAPVVVANELQFIAAIQCHHADTGGAAPGVYLADAPDVWAEGVRFPSLKVVERGVQRVDALCLLKTNLRSPAFLSDVGARIAAVQHACGRLKELVARHGGDRIRAAVEHSIEQARRRFREEVRLWPDGVYYGDAYVDNDPLGNPDVHVHLKITVRGDRLTVDFTGSDMRQNLCANSSFGNTRGHVVAQLAAMMDPTIPKNEGFVESIELVVPKGCCLNPHDNRPVTVGTHHPGVEVNEAIANALGGVLPERACPQISKMGMPPVILGMNPATGKRFVDPSADTFAAYCGAVKGRDGWGAMNAAFGNWVRAGAEFSESILPHRQLARDYATDTGGPGQWRGCPGSLLVKALTAPATVYAYVVGRKHPMPGTAGGKNGMPNEMRCRVGSKQELVAEGAARQVPHHAGESYAYRHGGGGGWGDPLERDPEAVREDVLDEYVSMRGARFDYGVVLTGSVEELDVSIDWPATRELREQMRADREGRR